MDRAAHFIGWPILGSIKFERSEPDSVTLFNLDLEVMLLGMKLIDIGLNKVDWNRHYRPDDLGLDYRHHVRLFGFGFSWHYSHSLRSTVFNLGHRLLGFTVSAKEDTRLRALRDDFRPSLWMHAASYGMELITGPWRLNLGWRGEEHIQPAPKRGPWGREPIKAGTYRATLVHKGKVRWKRQRQAWA